jgi:hypothetical protein
MDFNTLAGVEYELNFFTVVIGVFLHAARKLRHVTHDPQEGFLEDIEDLFLIGIWTQSEKEAYRHVVSRRNLIDRRKLHHLSVALWGGGLMTATELVGKMDAVLTVSDILGDFVPQHMTSHLFKQEEWMR